MGEKCCTKCKTVRPIGDFFKDKRGDKDGRRSRCRECSAEAFRAFRKRNPGYDSRRYWSNRDSERERHLVKKYGGDVRRLPKDAR